MTWRWAAAGRGKSGQPLAPRGKNEVPEAGGRRCTQTREIGKDTVHSNGVVACKNKLGKKELFLTSRLTEYIQGVILIKCNDT